MMSNLSDQWARFKLKIMDAGAFDWLKGKLEGLQALVDKMAADGSLNRLAREWGQKLTHGLQAAWDAAKKVWRVFQDVKAVLDNLAGAIGGYEKLMIAVGVTMGVRMVAQVALLVTSLAGLATTTLPMLGTAFVTMSTTAVGAIGAVLKSLAPLWPALVMMGLVAGSQAVGEKSAGWQYSKMGTASLEQKLKEQTTLGGGPNSSQARMIRQELTKRYADEADKTFNGKIQVEIKSAHPVRVTELKSSHNLDLDVDAGRTMTGAGW
jgi:hypothetical protein